MHRSANSAAGIRMPSRDISAHPTPYNSVTQPPAWRWPCSPSNHNLVNDLHSTGFSPGGGGGGGRGGVTAGGVGPVYCNFVHFKGNVGKTSERRGRAHMGFSERIDTTLS